MYSTSCTVPPECTECSHRYRPEPPAASAGAPVLGPPAEGHRSPAQVPSRTVMQVQESRSDAIRRQMYLKAPSPGASHEEKKGKKGPRSISFVLLFSNHPSRPARSANWTRNSSLESPALPTSHHIHHPYPYPSPYIITLSSLSLHTKIYQPFFFCLPYLSRTCSY